MPLPVQERLSPGNIKTSKINSLQTSGLVMCHPRIQEAETEGSLDHKFETSLGNTARLFQKK